MVNNVAELHSCLRRRLSYNDTSHSFYFLQYESHQVLHCAAVNKGRFILVLRASRLPDVAISPGHRIKIHIEGPLTSEALKFLSSRMSHYACWPPFS
jgi:hypothetical protein